MDLRRKFILNKNLETCSWEILPWTPLQLLATHNFLPCVLFAHIFSMNNIISHIRTNFPFTHSFSSFFLKKNTQGTTSLLVSLLWPLLELVLLVQWKFGNPSLQSMASSSFMNQWESRMIFSPMEFRMKILMPNETLRKFYFLIK